MLFTSFFRAVCLGATLVTVWGIGGGNITLDNKTCQACGQSPGCFECLSITENANGTSTVEIDFSGCKNDDISWACCTGSSIGNVFTSGACSVPSLGCSDSNGAQTNPEGGRKCNDVSIMTVHAPAGATEVTINTHDGQTAGTAIMNPLCGGNPNNPNFFQNGCSSAPTGHCLIPVLLSSCPQEETTGVCTGKEKGYVCREAVDACDIDDVCDGESPHCPCDNKYTGGYTLKCGNNIVLCGPGQTELGSWCNIGANKNTKYIELDYPKCIENGEVELLEVCSDFVPGLSEQGSGLSNFAHGVCTENEEEEKVWICDEKEDVPGEDEIPEDYFPYNLKLDIDPQQCFVPATASTGGRHLRGPLDW